MRRYINESKPGPLGQIYRPTVVYKKVSKKGAYIQEASC